MNLNKIIQFVNVFFKLYILCKKSKKLINCINKCDSSVSSQMKIHKMFYLNPHQKTEEKYV